MLDDSAESAQPRGLGNLGNTCYLNAALQALCSLQPLVQHFAHSNERIQTAAFPTERQLALAFGQFTRSLGNTSVVGPTWPIEMLEAVVACNPSFDGGLQQDAHELLRSLLDGLHDALKAPLAEVVAAEYSRSFLRRWRPPNEQGSGNLRQKVLVPESSVVERLFQGQLVSSVTCCCCGTVSSVAERSLDISVEVAGNHGSSDACSERPLALHECLKSFFASEHLDGDNMYACKQCECKRKADKAMRLLHLPPLLVIHLKRFHYDSSASKKKARVDFPLDGMSLSDFVAPGTDGCGYEFTLSAVVAHHGDKLSNGHYTAYVRPALTEEQWYHCDDGTVKAVSAKSVQEAEAYMLFYSRQPSQPKLRIDTSRARLKAQPAVLRTYVQGKRVFSRRLLRMGSRGGTDTDSRRAALLDLPVVFVPSRLEKVCLQGGNDNEDPRERRRLISMLVKRRLRKADNIVFNGRIHPLATNLENQPPPIQSKTSMRYQ